METAQHYLINMADGRVILYTKQAARQVNYHPISEEVALAVGNGEISWKDVVSRIKANLINNQDAWDDLLKRKTTMNVRKSTLTPEDSEGTETAPETEDVKEEFKMNELEKPAPATVPAKEPTSRRSSKRQRAPEPEPTEDTSAETPPEEEKLDL